MSKRREARRPGIATLMLALAGSTAGWSAALAQRGAANLGAEDVTVPEGPLNPSTLYLRSGLQLVGEARQVSRLLTADNGAPAKHFVIQLDGPMTPERREALTSAGLVLGQYLPVNAYIANFAPGARPADLDRLGFVRFASEFDASWKIDPVMGRRPAQTGARQALADQGLVLAWVYLFTGEDVRTGVAALGAIPGVQVIDSGDLADNPCITVQMTADAAGPIAALKSVQFVEEAPEATMRNNTSRTVVQSGTLAATPFYANGITGLGQVAGLMDGRPNIQHCSFRDPENDPAGVNHRKFLAYNATSGSDSHGTHTAGTMAGDSGSFTDNLRGVAYEALMVFNTIPSDSSTGTTFLSRLNQHHTQGARVHSNSWGADGTTAYNGWSRAIDLYSRANEDGMVAFAVSNGGTATTPENGKSCLAVGATQDNASINNHCSGGQGPTADQRRKPETYAPGCSTTSSSGGVCATASLTGTSMACPAVTGAAALVRQYFTDGFYPTGAANASDAMTPTGALLRAMIINGSVDMTGVAGYPSNREGWGRLVADYSAFFPGDTRTLLVHDVRNASAEAFTAPGQSIEYTFDVVGSTEQLRVTMTFTDVAAALNAAFTPINDVDLEVVDPNGDSVYLGNVFSAGVSVTGGAADARNSTEQVHISAPIAGTWTVRVRSTAVNQETQGFALVITGEVADASVVLCPGDTNGDNIINFADLNTVLAQFGQTGAGLSGDVDGDNDVDFADLNIVLANFGIVC